MMKIPMVKVVLSMDCETFSREVFGDFQDCHRDVAVLIGETVVEMVVHTNSESLPHVLNFVGNLYANCENGIESMYIGKTSYAETI
jgi:hypothetical protein